MSTLFADSIGTLTGAEAERVIADLRRAVRRSWKTGGRYTIAVGDHCIGVQVTFSEREAKR